MILPYWLWPWVLDFVGFIGLMLLAKKRREGWIVNTFCMGLWLVYAIQTHQWGFILFSVVYAVVDVRAFLRWKREETPYESVLL